MAKAAGKILIVDDEERIRRLLKLYLEKDGYETFEAEDGKTALEMILANSYDLVLLDLMLPEMSGIEVAKLVRKEKEVPIMMITARGEENNRVEGFMSGADDYIVKPFSPREVMLRVAAVLKRTKPLESESNTIDFPQLKIYPDSRLVLVDNVPINLTPKEFELLLYLSKSPEKIFTREVLLKEVWRYEFFGDLRTVDTHVKRLREKLLKQSKSVSKMIVTVWGMGYKFSPIDSERTNEKK
ncbi:transcriptional regulatory protein c terminal [Trichococcus palustris]|jgi:two-component system, OmpR family, response regulator ResD|uniref:Transcriptional regulatory protein c terminal n=1 Tax=Trichococcus palustris TaxID=140314 RepID=A0A143YCF2_9LACT|nr:response regulator transcription factor [Trichococcus palustris]CZQ83513.1 transcriptional regulatory protein c terminal [Trichococcus palustris]SFK69995.1 two-component system, OmpR family, response regulator ResD [Trichococcus palustris]